jgi:hypothetical protein
MPAERAFDLEKPKSYQSSYACLLANGNIGALCDYKINILPYGRDRETVFYGKLPN